MRNERNHRSTGPARTWSLGIAPGWQRAIAGGLALAVITLSACQAGRAPQAAQDGAAQVATPVPTVSIVRPLTPTTAPRVTPSPADQGVMPPPPPSPIPKSSPSPRNHVPPGTFVLFASVTFTSATTYEQAVALLSEAGTTSYPWTCDDPRTPVPPPPDQLRAAFATSHQLRLSYPTDDQLNRLASSALVLSVDATPMSMCP